MKDSTAPKSSLFISVQWLLLLSVTVLLTVILAGIFYWYYQFSTQQALDQIARDLTRNVQLAALNINGDELLALSKEGQPNQAGFAWQNAKENDEARKAAKEKFPAPHSGFSDDPRYQKLLDWMDTIHNIEPRAWTYVWVNDEEAGEIIYVVDLAARYNPEKSTLFNERIEDSNWTTELTLSTNEEGKLESYVDDWGEWYSAWAPIYDSRGQLIGGVGVDFQSGDVQAVQNAIRNTLLIAFALTYFVMISAVFLISRMITKPIKSLTQAADAVGEGNYDQDFADLYGGKYFHNEVGVLAHVFDVMVEKIQQRVTKLQQQVQELRIEIDQNKRKKQVDEISGTEFFQNLQVKAKAMRRQRNKKDGG